MKKSLNKYARQLRRVCKLLITPFKLLFSGSNSRAYKHTGHLHKRMQNMNTVKYYRIAMMKLRGTHIQAYVDPMWSHHEGSMSIPRANLRWAHVDCRRRTHEVNVGGEHRAHVGPTYHCYLKLCFIRALIAELMHK